MTSAAATSASTSTTATCFPISVTSPGLFSNSDACLDGRSKSSGAAACLQTDTSDVVIHRSSHSALKWLPGDSTAYTSASIKSDPSRMQGAKNFGNWLSPKKARRGGVGNRSLPSPEVADDATDASSSGLDEGLALLPPSFRDTRKISNASSLESATEASTSLPNPLLPPFASSPRRSVEGCEKSPVAGSVLGNRREPSDRNIQESVNSPARLSGLFGPISDFTSCASHIHADVNHIGLARLELQRSIRKLDNALARLKRCQADLNGDATQGPAVNEIMHDLTASTTPGSPDGSAHLAEGHLNPNVNSTPTRSRLFRSLRSASSSSRRGSPHLASPGTPETPSNFRSWSSALHAILSPSPTLPRMFTSPSPRGESPSPMLEQLESAQVGLNNLVDQVRRAQADILSALQHVHERSEAASGSSVPLKEPVIFLAQAIVSGLELPATGPATSSFKVLKQAAVALLLAFAAVLARQAPHACKLPDSGVSHAHVLLQSFGDRLDSSTIHDVFASEDEARSSDDTQRRYTHDFVNIYRSFASELRHYHNAARKERRQHRIDRRSARLQKATNLYGKQSQRTTLPGTPDGAGSNTNIALLSSQELFEHTLHRALRDDLYTVEEVEAYDPRVLLTLPRLAIAFGVRESSFPSWQPGQQDLVKAGSSQVLLEVFLPRICRALPINAVNSTKAMSSADFERMARRLSIADGHVAIPAGDDAHTAYLNDVFRAISTLADSSGPANKGRHTKLMRKVLKSYLAPAEGRPEDDDEDEYTIARAFLAVAGLGS